MKKWFLVMAFISAGMALSAQSLTPLSGHAMIMGVWEMEEADGLVWQIAVFNGGTTMNLRNREAGDPDSARGLSFISINTSWDSATEGRILFKPPGDSEESTIEFRTMIDLATGRRYLDLIEGSAFKAGTYKWVRAR